MIFKMTKVVSITARGVINENRTTTKEETAIGDIASTIATIMKIASEVGEAATIASKVIAVANRIIINLTLRTLRCQIT